MAAQGWCPSTHRLFAAPDGALARVRVPGGRLTSPQLRAVATAARRLGSGAIELTRRANLQVRGLDPACGTELRSLLAPVGLAAPTAVAEDRRNVMGSPTAGFAPDEVLDVTGLVDQACAALTWLDPDLALTHKFGVLLDGGGTPSLRGIPADLALGARTDAAGRVRLEVALGRALDTADGTGVAVRPDQVPALVAAAARVCASGGGRMRDVVERRTADDVLAEIADDVLLTSWAVAFEPPDTSSTIEATDRSGTIGTWAAADGRSDDVPTAPAHAVPWVELGPVAAVDATAFAALADVVERAGGAEVRLTPWRTVVVPPLPDLALLVERAMGAGWASIDAGDRRGAQPIGAGR